jgi:PAS domain S-box-containing protein
LIAFAHAGVRHGQPLASILSGVIGVLIAGRDGSIIEANDYFLRMLGYTRDEFRRNGLLWNTLTPPEWSTADQHSVEAVRKSGVCPPYDKEYFRKDGSRVPVQLTVATPDDVTGEYLCLVTDISERKRAEVEMQRLAGRLLHAQDDEQRRLARELHDSTAQLTAALAINLTVLAGSTATLDPAQCELLAECESLAQRVTKELRTVSYLLHPPALDSLGLVRAIEDYARGFAARSGLAVQLELPENLGRLPDAIELSLFRVVQETLSNAHRHADCKNIVVRLARLEDRITIEVRDDGCGLPAVTTAGSAGVGIAGMRERLRLLGGRLEIEAAQPGTRVRAILPLSAGGRS